MVHFCACVCARVHACVIAWNVFCLRTALRGRESTFFLTCQRKLKTNVRGAFHVLSYVLILAQTFHII